jgi:extracellular elastinolytic metalloproteinase
VLISLQDTSGTNGADSIATPADGQSAIMRMFLWTTTSPSRDSAVENDLVVHEITHSVTSRMTGGGTSRCLQTTEAGGLGEGWSDVMAFWTEQKNATVSDYTIGVYVYTRNIRSHPYSTSAATNPLRYSSVKTLNEVHSTQPVYILVFIA